MHWVLKIAFFKVNVLSCSCGATCLCSSLFSFILIICIKFVGSSGLHCGNKRRSFATNIVLAQGYMVVGNLLT